ncbi:hypothetical protein BWK59_13975 [Flavobacterium davisii]|uniref:DUF4184 family protein n=1 Tax=Flavobacterium davisii TaxID=2906077 RepID=A0A246GF95_9FLAO|nr:DUF4184 family protein [Flavobacterium davisii]OWP82793.1 hypothetical protein BWK59_13975 [Flavobacterium davisii]
MPLTFSHPAIILPLTCFSKKRFSLTGLIIGSMVPDFEYFLRMKVKSIYSHSITGIFWFDLPFAILLTFIFHNIIRNSLFNNLPLFFKSRLLIFKSFDWNSYFKENKIVVLFSLFIGISSHILWDDFTHKEGYFVQKIPFLKSHIHLFKISISVFKVLQHSSTLLGGLFILFFIYKLPINNIKFRTIHSKYWIIFISITLTIIISRIIYEFDVKRYGDLITSCISALLSSLILTPILLNKINIVFKKSRIKEY